MDALVKERACPLCGCAYYGEFNRYRDFQFFSDPQEGEPKRTDVASVRCCDCGLLFMNPTYTESGFLALFSEAGQSYGSTRGRQDEVASWITGRIDLTMGSSVCDIGCYEGGLLSRFRPDVQRFGVDIDEPAIRRARDVDPMGTYVLGDLHDFVLQAPPDLFTMFHVLEHVERPVELLANLWRQSNEETKLVLEVPILELVRTEDVCGFFTVQHLTHFTRRTLRASVESAGWRIEEWLEQEGYNGCRLLCRRDSGPRAIEDLNDGREDLVLLYQVISDWHRNLSRHAATLAQLEGVREVVVWGAGMHTETLQARFGLLSTSGVERWSLLDSDPLKHGTHWRGIEVQRPEYVTDVDWSQSRLLISTYHGQEAVVAAALSLGVPEAAIVKLYSSFRRY